MHLKFQKLLGGMPSDPQGAHTWDERTAILSPTPHAPPPPSKILEPPLFVKTLVSFGFFCRLGPTIACSTHPSSDLPPPTWKAGYGHEKPPPLNFPAYGLYGDRDNNYDGNEKLADSYLYKEGGGHVGVSVIWSKVKLHRPIFPRLLQLPPAHLDPPLMHATLFY